MDNSNKSEFRKECIRKLKISSNKNKLRKDKFISNEIKKIIINNKIKNILLYLPLNIEVDLRQLIKWLRQNNYKVYVPFITGKTTFKAVPYRLPLKKNKYNIYEANNSNIKINIKFDMAIVPIIGFDDSFRRIGFGVGFYDRYFSKLSYRPLVVFTQLETCKSKEIITFEHDLKADFIVNNKGKLWKKN